MEKAAQSTRRSSTMRSHVTAHSRHGLTSWD
jgi:hypothetical protein